ncbi:MAG TPA: hypothetical protein VMH86_14360 [Rhizomicrobium sp.]|nr:hypothetical protein [Rhizomicrobium sp.]
MAAGREILIEFVPQGNVVKVTAIDVATRTEAAIVAPAGAPQATLRAAVLRKLDYLLKKQNGGA